MQTTVKNLDTPTEQTEESNAEAIPVEYHIIEDDKEKEDEKWVNCQECGKRFKFITASHLKKYHSMSTEQYIKKYPNARLRGKHTFTKIHSKKYRDDRLRIELISNLKNKKAAVNNIPTSTQINSILIDKDKITTEKINQSQTVHTKDEATEVKNKAKNYKPEIYSSNKKIVDIEEYMRNNIGLTGEHIFVNLYKIATYDFKTSKDKRPQYSPGDIIRSSELILAYCYGRPTQRQVIDANVRQVTFTVGKPLPEELNPEDF